MVQESPSLTQLASTAVAETGDVSAGVAGSSAPARSPWAAALHLGCLGRGVTQHDPSTQLGTITMRSAMLIGKLVVDRSANACLEHILSIEGSRMQRELANIILWKHRDSPSRMQLLHNHFYPEIVFTELKPDEPLLRWRTRNIVCEDGASSRRDEANADDYTDVKPQSSNLSKISPGPVNPFQGSPGPGDLLADPLDCIVFGHQELSEEIRHVDGVGIPRSQRRAHRRARPQHHRDRHAKTHSHSTKC